MSLHIIMRCIIVMICVSAAQAAHVQQKKPGMTINLRQVRLADSIRMMARMLDMNVIISPAVTGMVTLALSNVSPEDILSALLLSHDLAKWRIGRVWLIAPRGDLIRRRQDEFKWIEQEDEAEPLSLRIWQIKYANAQDIGRLLQDEHASLLSRRGRVRIDTRTNRICIQDAESRLRNMQKLIDRFDVPVRQVSIKARIVSVDSDFERELGVKFSASPAVTEKSGYDLAGSGGIMPDRHRPGGASIVESALLDMHLSALESAGHAKLISSPSLFTANQQEAWIEAGEEVPYQEVSEGGGTATVFKKAVLGLKVTPQILPGNQVLLNLQISQDRPGGKQVQGVPTINTHKMMTRVLVKSGQTIVLGGIFEENRENLQSGVPFIHDLPILGGLFRMRNHHDSKRELLIFVTPRILSGEEVY
ncbi:Type IV pilus biogenesis and competence protein PilQ [Aquicella siphonis]|uniref:Type IV pilus biogenesis and competence protein PilQ n=1 Tax=Aquicella siphonis TaxID=254247 RepID=A0A5E4PJM6_9COXI|nr:secretin N-terminal domain-containing protein [Aquicella siphonis]VVC76658.1 Type IV pilus biogenesis and competence protein PilQ [Aquicella siphonis]